MFNSTMVINEKPVYFTAMAIYSFLIISLETIFFHMLLIVTNYIDATFIITLALLGIATGSFISFYLLRFRTFTVMLVSSLLFYCSIVYSYYNIISIGSLTYPFFLVLPFFFGTIIISSIFSKQHSNTLYFTNLIASAAGVIFPIFAVSALKSENAIILLLILPLIFSLLISFTFRNRIIRLLILFFSVILIYLTVTLLKDNLSLPEVIPAKDFEEQVIPRIETKYDRQFVERVYRIDEEKNEYMLVGDEYDKIRAKHLLHTLGYKTRPSIDLNEDVKSHELLVELKKIYTDPNLRVLYSEDNLLGRVEITGTDAYMTCAINGVLIDGIDDLYGRTHDPRIPHVKEPRIFIVGLSADGIVKPAKKIPGAQVSGIEIVPAIIKVMQEGRIAEFSRFPYADTEVYCGEGRSFLESSPVMFDIITLMNVHPEHGPISTLAPEHFHTVEGITSLLNKVSDRGIVVFEEILMNDRSRFAFVKFLNTIVEALKRMGMEQPLDHIIVFAWDFNNYTNYFRTVTIKRTPYSEEDIEAFDRYLSVLRRTFTSTELLLYPGRTLNSVLEEQIAVDASSYETDFIPASFSITRFITDIASRCRDKDDLHFVLTAYSMNEKYKRYYLNTLSGEDKTRLKDIFKKIDYPFELDLGPVTDDAPFPFNIYKNKKEVKDILLLIITIVLILFIPLLSLILTKYKKHKWFLPSSILYFAFIGFGYLLVEIVLMQKFQRFIGNPTYSLIVTLGGLLLFSGFGSFFSRSFSKKVLLICLCCIPVLLLFQLFFLDSLFVAFAHFGFIVKLLISALIIFPLGFLMGMPFPHMLEQIKTEVSKEYGTLMYGVSGAFSTVASTSSLYITVTHGFGMTFIIGILSYVFGTLLFAALKR